MGKLIDGKWEKADVATTNKEGGYDRIPRSFLDKISADHPKFRPEKSRYHLYVSYACPWAHRTLIMRELKELSSLIDVSVVSPDMLDEGWTFETEFPGSTGDKLYNKSFMREIYVKADPKVTTSVTVPVLWDKENETIVNNESSDIIRIFNTAFNELTGNKVDFYPQDLRPQIDEINELVYHNINNGVYKSGFAKTQKAYDTNVAKLFESLEEIEKRLEGNDYLVANTFTEADIRLVTTLLRFDPVYHGHFKCNKKRIKDYKNLSRYTANLYSMDAIKKTTNYDHIVRHYHYSHENINPYRIIPIGPEAKF